MAMMALGCGVGVSEETSYKQVPGEVWGDTPFLAPSWRPCGKHLCSMAWHVLIMEVYFTLGPKVKELLTLY